MATLTHDAKLAAVDTYILAVNGIGQWTTEKGHQGGDFFPTRDSPDWNVFSNVRLYFLPGRSPAFLNPELKILLFNLWSQNESRRNEIHSDGGAGYLS